jgi:hypothetical protein
MAMDFSGWFTISRKYNPAFVRNGFGFSRERYINGRFVFVVDAFGAG